MKINPEKIINKIQGKLNEKYPDAKIEVSKDKHDKNSELRSLEIKHNIDNGSEEIYRFVNKIMLNDMPEITTELLKRVNPDNEMDDDGRPAWIFEINVQNMDINSEDCYFYYIEMED